jgi:GGDEF domain-containing protein
VFRLGGDEFALVLEADSDGAESAMWRVARAIEDDTRCRGVGASWGVSEFRDGDDPAALLVRADAALYEMKPLGARDLVAGD